jgi:hypothetical protein
LVNGKGDPNSSQLYADAGAVLGNEDGGSGMSSEPTEVYLQADQMNLSGQKKTYITEKLRGAAVMYAPTVVLDLFEGISVLVTALGRLPNPKRSRAARILRPIMAVGVLAP